MGFEEELELPNWGACWGGVVGEIIEQEAGAQCFYGLKEDKHRSNRDQKQTSGIGIPVHTVLFQFLCKWGVVGRVCFSESKDSGGNSRFQALHHSGCQ